ncbi:MAG: 3-dehydroquinate synthase [Dehalococcoidia bacterium]
MTRRPLRIVLTGFSGSGKSLVAPLVADRLRWQVIDTDSLVERAAGKPITEIFARDGEPHFRELEADAVREACASDKAVVSVGGGAVLRPDNRRLLAVGGFVVCLEARPETVLRRLREAASAEEPLDRPLLAGPDPIYRIRELKAARQPFYALADHSVHTDGLSPDAIAEEVVRAWRRRSAQALADPGRLTAFVGSPVTAFPAHSASPGAACVVRTASATYPVYVDWNALFDLGLRLREAGLTAQAYIISDETVFAGYGKQVEAALAQAGIPVASYTVPPGEASKSLETAAAIYDWLIQQKAERGHVVVALGGGMVTDLAGYVAATYLRGLPLVHVPTSLLAMVDAAIGGKVAVNHPQAKNAIGAFYQPSLVVADVSALRSLPPRELTSGWAELIKHALILEPDLLAFLEEHADAALRLEPEPTTEAIRRSVAIKAAVVSEDEREETGRRTILNYGHTVAHAIEAATEYGRLPGRGFLHGEAVAIGMTAAAAISQRLGLLSAEVERRQRGLLERFALPVRARGLDRSAVLAAMALDKKVRAGEVRWVLLEDVGRTVLRDDVPLALVEEVLGEVLV